MIPLERCQGPRFSRMLPGCYVFQNAVRVQSSLECNQGSRFYKCCQGSTVYCLQNVTMVQCSLSIIFSGFYVLSIFCQQGPRFPSMLSGFQVLQKITRVLGSLECCQGSRFSRMLKGCQFLQNVTGCEVLSRILPGSQAFQNAIRFQVLPKMFPVSQFLQNVTRLIGSLEC